MYARGDSSLTSLAILLTDHIVMSILLHVGDNQSGVAHLLVAARGIEELRGGDHGCPRDGASFTNLSTALVSL